MAEVLGSGTSKLTLALADVFAEDSESEQPFYGFSDNELSDHCDTVPNSHLGDEAVEALPGLNPSEKTSKPSSEKTSKSSTGGRVFRLRVALRSAPISKQQSTDEDEEEEEESSRAKKRPMEQTGNKSRAKKMKLVKFEDEETAVGEERGSDSAEDEADSFLAKRQKNIKDNKAMLAQLMADLNKMPGGVGILKKEAGKQKTKGRSARPPRSGAADGESRRNPERASRRQTRSMAGGDGPSAPKDEEMELSLEEELLEVRRAPQRRGAPRPNQSKPHVIRPVGDITEDELQLIADNTTEKVYNRVTGSTCHQCRQKTIDTKTCCRSEECRGIVGQFCGPCLKNRYGEEVKTALLDPEWKCPPCRGICNCSFCRTREGRCPTGILFPLAQYHGFSDVHSYLSSLRNKLKSDDNDVEL